MKIEKWLSMSLLDRTLLLESKFMVNGLGSPRKKLLGVGVNDSRYITKPIIDGFRVDCPAYRSWTGMMMRCYDSNYQSNRQTYIGVSVCNEWHSFMAFRGWWIANQVDGWQLDKDLVGDGKLYSPSDCVFVPAWLNTFTVDCGASRGEFPIGTNFRSDICRFEARCRNVITKKREHLGYFTTPECAHSAWKGRKLELALELKPKIDSIDPRIYQRVVEIINDAK